MWPEWTRGRIASRRGWIGAISKRVKRQRSRIDWGLRGGSNFNWKSRGQVRFFCIVHFVFLFLTSICGTAYTGLTRTLTSSGEHGRKQVVDLLSLSVNSYVFRQAHPELRNLQKALCSCISQHYNSYLEPEVMYYQFFKSVIVTVFLILN